MRSDTVDPNLSATCCGSSPGPGLAVAGRIVALVGAVLAAVLLPVLVGGPAGGGPPPAAAAGHDGPRPTDAAAADGYRTDDVRTLRAGRFAVHWVTTTNDRATTAFVKDVVAVLGEVHGHLVGELGWLAPVDDGGAGGTDEVDVYLLDLGGVSGGEDQPFGYAAMDRAPRCGGGRCAGAAGFVVLDNDYDGYPPDPAGALRATVAHEYGHLLHFATAPTAPGWALESTGVWFESSTYPDVDARSTYVGDLAATTSLPLTDFGTESGGFDRAYGAYLLQRWLVERHGPDVLRDAWTVAAGHRGDVAGGYVAALRRRGSSFVEELLGFAARSAVWDLAGTDLDPAVAAWPAVPRAAELVQGEVAALEVDHAAWWVADLDVGDEVEVVVRGRRNVAAGAALVAVAADGSVQRVEDPTLVDGEARLALSGLADAQRVSLVVVNGDLTPARPKPPQEEDVRYLRDDVPFVVGVGADPGTPPRPCAACS